MKSLFYIFIGGGTGCVLRYLLSCLLSTRAVADGGFPWATWTANVAGCFLIGLFYGLSDRIGWSTDVRLLLTTGFCGGFTTFSTFGNEGLTLFRQGHYTLFGVYVVTSLLVGMAAVWAGGRLTVHT